MYVHLGQNIVINEKDVVGIFDIDKCSISKRTRKFLEISQKNGTVINVSTDIPKSFIVCSPKKKENKVYISPISCYTLRKRANNPD